MLWFEPGVDVRTAPAQENLRVSGGTIKFMGDEMNPVTVNTTTEDPHVNIYISDGSTIAARNTHFSNLLFGVFVTNNAFVDPEHSFYNCTFEHGVHALLRLENSQDIVIHNAHFPTQSAPYNVQKTSFNHGSVTLINATGAFAGEEFENDPHGRIHWEESTPYDRTVEDYVLEDGEQECFDAENTITVSYFMAMSGSSVKFIAGYSIVFLPETHIKSGAEMHAYITENQQFCSSVPSMLASQTKNEPPVEIISEDAFQSPNNQIRVYPNPTTGSFTLEIIGDIEATHLQIQIYNMRDEIIENSVFPSLQKYDLNLSGHSGLYIVRVIMGDKIQVARIIKQ